MCGAVGVGVIGIASMGLYVAEADRTWFEGLFPADFLQATTPVGGRPAPETCLAFVLLGGSLVSLVLRRAPLVGQALGVAGASVGLSAVAGYALGADRANLGTQFVYVGMALHTGVGIALVGVAVVCVRPTVGFVAQLLAGGIVGGISRRVTLVVAAAPAILLLAGITLGQVLPTPQLVQSVFAVLQVAVLSAAVLIPGGMVGHTERQLRSELDAVRRVAEDRSDVDTLADAVTAEMTITEPRLPNWEVAMRYAPATGHLAGDSVQVHLRTQPRPATLLAIVDVAGHDVFSSVVAYGLRAHIGAMWEMGAGLHDIVSSVNATLMRQKTIATAVFVVQKPEADSMEVLNAGHPAPVHVRSGTQTRWTRTGPLLGISGAVHETNVFEILPGDLVVIYTDGVTEARSADGTELGDFFVSRLINARRDESPSTIASACVDAALGHAGARLSDDVLVLAARRLHVTNEP